ARLGLRRTSPGRAPLGAGACSLIRALPAAGSASAERVEQLGERADCRRAGELGCGKLPIAVAHPDETPAGGTCGIEVVMRVADVRRVRRLDAELFGRGDEGHWARLLLGHAVAADHELESVEQPGLLEQRIRVTDALVRHA